MCALPPCNVHLHVQHLHCNHIFALLPCNLASNNMHMCMHMYM